MAKEYVSVWKKAGPDKNILKVLPQRAKTRFSIKRDLSRKAMLPGKRISRTGKIYWETRENRSDMARKKI